MEECRNLVAKVRESGDRRLLGEVQFKTCHPLFNSSRYREAKRSADEGFAILLEGYEESPYLNLNFQIYEHLVGLCHLFLGEWGDALRNVTHRIEICEKNGDHLSAIANGAMRPRVQIHAMDFAGAQQFLESALPLLMPVPVAYRQNLIFAGLAEAALGNHKRALEYLLKCREEMDQRPMMPDWYESDAPAAGADRSLVIQRGIGEGTPGSGRSF